MFLTPSMNSYHCFSCRSKGRLTNLLNKFTDITYFEAAKYVVHAMTTPPEKKVFEIQHPWQIAPLPDYRERGFSKAVFKHFQCGITDEGWMAIPYLVNGEVKGVQYRKNSDGDRMMFNAPGFEKSQHIYNFTGAGKTATAVEGYSDVWRLWDWDVENPLGLWGVSVSPAQAEILANFDTLYIATDMDKPGRLAAEHIYYQVKAYGPKILFVPMPEKDPGAMESVEDWQDAQADAIGYNEYSYFMNKLWGNDYEIIKSDIMALYMGT